MTDRITRADVERLAESCNVHVATWSPGDGMTRYRFTVHARTCTANPNAETAGERYCGCLDYFGASGESNLGTALGVRDAYTWLQGFRAALLQRDRAILARQHDLNAHPVA